MLKTVLPTHVGVIFKPAQNSFVVSNLDTNDKKSKSHAKAISVADTSSFLVFDFSDKSSKPSKLFLDGLEKDFSPVYDSGKIIKREFDGSQKTARIIFDNGEVLEETLQES